MGRNEKDCPNAHRRRRKGAVLAIVFVSVVTMVGAAESNLTEAKVQKAQKMDSDYVDMENKGCETMELNPLRKEEYPEITEAVREYYKQQEEEASFVDSYEDITVYTKQGIYRGTYVVFARYDMKIKEIYTKVPGLGTLYIVENEADGYQVNAAVEDEKVKDYIQVIAQHRDVQALMDETQSLYQEAVGSDALLKEALSDLKNAYEGSGM